MAARTNVSPLLTAAILTAAFAASPLAAQDRNAGQFGHSRHGSTFDEGPRQRPRAMAGLSPEVHLPVQGLDEATQRLFDQGLCQQHGFWYFEAERSFREVASRVPTCALAYWGMAMANVDNRERAAGFAARAVQHAAALPECERLYVDAIAVLYQIDDALRSELQSGDAARVQKAIDDAIAKAKTGRDEKELQRAFETIAKGKVKARYVGAGLVLTGAVTQAEYRKVLWEVLRRSLGRFALDDQLEVQSPPAADAGVKP